MALTSSSGSGLPHGAAEAVALRPQGWRTAQGTGTPGGLAQPCSHLPNLGFLQKMTLWSKVLLKTSRISLMKLEMRTQSRRPPHACQLCTAARGQGTPAQSCGDSPCSRPGHLHSLQKPRVCIVPHTSLCP